MLNMTDIMETITMIQEENLDIRTITMGISLLDCFDGNIRLSCDKVYEKIYKRAKNLGVLYVRRNHARLPAVRDDAPVYLSDARDIPYHGQADLQKRPDIRDNPLPPKRRHYTLVRRNRIRDVHYHANRRIALLFIHDGVYRLNY